MKFGLFLLTLTIQVTVLYATCPSPWKEYNSTCYLFSQNRYNFQDALSMCGTYNGTLYSRHPSDEQFVVDNIKEGGSLHYWVALRVENNKWTWLDGTPYTVNSTKWIRNTQGNVNDHNRACASIISYKPYIGMTEARNCREGWPIICIRENTYIDLCNEDDGWVKAGQQCIKIYTTQRNWFDAKDSCQFNGGSLFEPRNQSIQNYFYELSNCRVSKNRAWIGVSDTVFPGRYTFASDNATLRYGRWVSYGNAIITRGNTCIFTKPLDNYGWQSETCDTEKEYVCERPEGVCPEGWMNHVDKCYQVITSTTSQTSWFEASNFCQKQAAQLLYLENTDEENFVRNLLTNAQVTEAWLGYSDARAANTYIWEYNNQDITQGYTNFARNQFPPQHPTNTSRCGTILIDSRSSQWTTNYCYNSKAFVCKGSLMTSPATPSPSPVLSHCDPDWKQYNGNCYYFGSSSGINFNDAQRQCFSNNSYLVSIKNPYEQSFITVNQALSSTAWIGLKYSKVNGRLEWTQDSTPLKFQNFYPGEPDDLTDGASCIKIVGGRQDYTGAWDDANCTALYDAFICEKGAYDGPPNSTVSTPKALPWSYKCGGSGWIYDAQDNFCYQVVVDSPKAWQDAQWDCNQRGGNLTSISGPREQNFIQAMLATGEYARIQYPYWIGGTDGTKEGGWEWVDNTALAYINWHAGEPNDNTALGEDCMEIVPEWSYQWNDAHCDGHFNYICKKNALLPTAGPGAPTPPTFKESCIPEAMISGNYSLLDATLLKSSSDRDSNHMAQNSRYYPNSQGGWSAATNTLGEHLEVSFYNPIIVKQVVTAGRTDADEWVTSYMLMYQEDSFSEYVTYQEPPGTNKTFTANSDGSTPVTNTIAFPFEAQGLRILPITYNNGISMRWEVLGCYEENCNAEYGVSGPLVVTDNAITASSYSDIYHTPGKSRIKLIQSGDILNCWRPSSSTGSQWIQYDLGNIMFVRGVTIAGNPMFPEWVTSFKVAYSSQPGAVWNYIYYQEPYGKVKTFTGNSNNTDKATHFFKGHFQARIMRIYPVAFQGFIALQADFLVCPTGCGSLPLINGRQLIPDSRLSASSQLDNEHGPSRSRLNVPSQGLLGGAWTAAYNDHNQYIEVDLGSKVQVTGVATQGRSDADEWIRSYNVSYSGDHKTWYSVAQYTPSFQVLNFAANWDRNSVRKHNFPFPIIARFVRLWPSTYFNRISLRWEVYGCPGPASGVRIGCYADDPYDRDLPYEPYSDPAVGMWPPMCIHHCYKKGYYYAGLQAQYKCFCGNSYGKYGVSTSCDQNCFPRTTFQCGGRQSNNVYSTGLTPAHEVCLPGWVSYEGMCYLLLTDKESWQEGRRQCKTMGGDLATINSQAVQDLIESLIAYEKVNSVWIGLNDQREENIFEWAASEPVFFTNWNVNQPQTPPSDNEDCVRMVGNSSNSRSTYGWQDDDCSIQSPYVCMSLPHGSPSPTPMPQTPGCNEGWSAYDWSCFRDIDMPKTFFDAQQLCRSRGATLVQIFSQTEQAYLSSILATKTGVYWTDVTDYGTPGSFHFYTGSGALPYTNWAGGRPNRDANGTNCVAMGAGFGAGLWYDLNCMTVKARPICQKIRQNHSKPTPPPTTTQTVPCPPNWVDGHDGQCYQINNVSRSRRVDFRHANMDCVTQSARLISIHTDALQNTIWRQYLVGSTGNFWTGLQRFSYLKGTYRWADATPVDYVHWGPNNNMNSTSRHQCVEIESATGNWYITDCALKKNWICAIRKAAGVTPRSRVSTTPMSAAYCSGNGHDNWRLYNNYCYYVESTNRMSWHDAQAYCQRHGGNLASILNIQEENFLVYLTAVQPTRYYIGFTEVDSLYGYRWVDGSTATYIHWGTNEPNNEGLLASEDCVVFNADTGMWEDVHCALNYGFICKAPPTPVTTQGTPPTTVVGSCLPGYVALDTSNKCYRVFDNLLSWKNASAFCRSQGNLPNRPGFYLASIQHSVENALLISMLAKGVKDPWFGLLKSNSSLLYVDNKAITFQNWGHGEPSGNLPKMCGKLSGHPSTAGLWRVESCDIPSPFICESPRQPGTTPEPTPTLCDVRQGFQAYNTDCFKFVPTPMNWTQARDNCQQQGGYLATISDVYEQSFLFILVQSKKPAWIGLHDESGNGTFSWTQPGWPVTYTLWRESQPSIIPNDGCVNIDLSGRWVNAPCGFPLASVCKITTAQPPLSPPPPNAGCPDDGWISEVNGERCLLVVTQPVSYLDAAIHCSQLRATVASIHNKVQNTDLWSYMKRQTSSLDGFWISLHKSPINGYTWSDGSPVFFFNWDNNHNANPIQHSPTESCAEVQLWNGRWNEIACSEKRPFICTKNKADDQSMITMPVNGKPTVTTFASPTMINTPTAKQGDNSKPPTLPATATHTPSPSKIPKPTIKATNKSYSQIQTGKKKKSGLSTGAILGILVAVLVVVAGSLFAIYFVWKKKFVLKPLSFGNFQYDNKNEEGQFQPTNSIDLVNST